MINPEDEHLSGVIEYLRRESIKVNHTSFRVYLKRMAKDCSTTYYLLRQALNKLEKNGYISDYGHGDIGLLPKFNEYIKRRENKQ